MDNVIVVQLYVQFSQVEKLIMVFYGVNRKTL
jgi:hypothetical protein